MMDSAGFSSPLMTAPEVGEISRQPFLICSRFFKVHRLAAWCQKQYMVEDFENYPRRLVDGAYDRNTFGCDATEERNDRIRN